MLREGARWRAQRGATLGALDELLGSASIFGTVETQFLLRSCSTTGVLLFLLWMLSPIGGQASLRLLSVRNSTIYYRTTLHYVAKEQAKASAFSGPSAWSRDRNHVRLLFESSRMSPIQATPGPEDMWTNVKMPYMELLPTSVVDENGWITNVQSGYPETAKWASDLGVPVIERDLFGSDTLLFSLETQYFTLDCADLRNTTCGTLADETAYQTNPTNWWDGNRVLNTSFILATTTPLSGRHEGNQSLPARDIIWQSNGTQGCVKALCSLALSHIEANVTCAFDNNRHRACLVTHVRPSRRPHPPNNYTPFDTPATLQNFFDKWPEMHAALGVEDPWPNRSSYYFGPYAPHFSKWLTVRWNTVWQAGVAPRYNTQMPHRTYDFSQAAVAAGREGVLVNGTSAKYAHSRAEDYACAMHWLALLVVASSALLLSAVVGFWAKYTTIAPDILTHASSMTRDNPYIPLPPGGNTLDGMERARALKHVRVRVQDVQPDAPVGHVALALDDAPTAGSSTSQPPATRAGYLQKRRRYA